ncbi:glycosyltransferase [Gordonia amicalis]
MTGRSVLKSTRPTSVFITKSYRDRSLALCGAVFATGIVAPALMAVWDSRRKISAPGDDGTRGKEESALSLEVVIPAYLEASVIPESISYIRKALTHWPGGSTSVRVIASDEETAVSASSADHVNLVGRTGKASAVNYGVAQSSADIVVLTDANCQIVPQDWPALLMDELQVFDLVSCNKGEILSSDTFFWAYERWVKSKQRNTLAVVGEFLAFRRRDYNAIPPDRISDDIAIAISFDKRGKRVGVSDQIGVLEEGAGPQEQWERRVRIASGQLYEVVPQFTGLTRSLAGRRYLIHKIYRLTVGPVAFWAAVAMLLRRAEWKGRAGILAGVLASVANYRYGFMGNTAASRATVVVGLQAVPPVAAVRALTRVGRGSRQGGQWQKVAR